MRLLATLAAVGAALIVTLPPAHTALAQDQSPCIQSSAHSTGCPFLDGLSPALREEILSQHADSPFLTSVSEKNGSTSGCPYLDGSTKCPYIEREVSAAIVGRIHGMGRTGCPYLDEMIHHAQGTRGEAICDGKELEVGATAASCPYLAAMAGRPPFDDHAANQEECSGCPYIQCPESMAETPAGFRSSSDGAVIGSPISECPFVAGMVVCPYLQSMMMEQTGTTGCPYLDGILQDADLQSGCPYLRRQFLMQLPQQHHPMDIRPDNFKPKFPGKEV